jgi:hypothetical protein
LDKKEYVRQSGLTTIRRREPTNDFIASKGPHMIFDYKNQIPAVPARVATGANGVGVTTNRSGRPYALNSFVGGSPDPSGHPLAEPEPVKFTEKARGK